VYKSTHKQIDTLDDIEKDFVLPVPDALGSPRNGICDRDRRPDHFQLV
jgi:hypothetical protein